MLMAMAREFSLRNYPVAVYTLHSTSLYGGGNPYSEGDSNARALRMRSLNFLKRVVGENLLEPTTCAHLLRDALEQTSQ